MKIKKIKTGLAMLLLVAGTASITSCKKDDPVDPPAPEVTKFDVTFNTNGGSAIEAVKVDENGKVTKPKDPTKQGYLFKGWFTDANCTTEFDFNTPITANTTIYAKFVLGISYSINFNDHCDGSLLDETYSIKNVSILPGCSLAGDTTETIDDQSYKRIKTEGSAQVFGNVPKNRGVSVKLGGPGKIKVWLAASGTSDRTVKVTNDGKKVLFEEKKSNDTELFTIELSVTEAQTLYIYGTNGFNIYRIDSEWEVPTDKGELESIAVSNVGSNQFIKSDDFSTNGLEVTATYSSGYEEILMQGNGDNEYTVDSSNYDGSQSGYYPITVNFKGKSATYNLSLIHISEPTRP